MGDRFHSAAKADIELTGADIELAEILPFHPSEFWDQKPSHHFQLGVILLDYKLGLCSSFISVVVI